MKKQKKAWAANCPRAMGGFFVRDPNGKRMKRGEKLCPYCLDTRIELLWRLVDVRTITDWEGGRP